MTDGTDWFAWHADYRDESSPLSGGCRSCNDTSQAGSMNEATTGSPS